MGRYILDQISSPDDVKQLSLEELDQLAGEIREFLVSHISKTGGHLASNLGIVEITLAIHKVFSTERDRLVFDVGHQSYVHKILTGRKDGFNTLRQLGGMCGFLCPEESIHDACVSGHASNSVSVALGMARARTLQQEDYSVISVIGDGALTGGLAYEALGDAGQSQEPLIVILNDNEMSITKNVGATSLHLARLRLKPQYLHMKGVYRRIMKRIPFGQSIDNVLHQLKNSFKRMFLPSSLFENMGFVYLGPASGHDLKYMLYLLELARDLKKPVLIHLTTKKGKGYTYSEENPQRFHGVSKFNVDSGEPEVCAKTCFSNEFGKILCTLGEENDKICAITAAMSTGTGLVPFAQQFPNRFFDVGIAEGHAVAMAAGLSKQGMVPVCAIYSTFLQRAYDMILHDVAIAGLHVVFAVDRAGLVGEDGKTHHGVFDVSFLRNVPGLAVLCPSNYAELSAMLRYAINEATGPIAVRYPRGGEGSFQSNRFNKDVSAVRLLRGYDVTLVTYGILVNQAMSASTGISVDLIKLNSIHTLDMDLIANSVARTHRLVVAEDCVEPGSVGSEILAELEKRGISCHIRQINLGRTFSTHGTLQDLYTHYGLDAEGMHQTLLEVLKVE